MKSVSESQFFMWRALFALVHTDVKAADTHVRFMAEAMEDIPFSADQLAQLYDDIKTPQDVEVLFNKVTKPQDRADFFQHAKNLTAGGSDFGADVQALLATWEDAHIARGDFIALDEEDAPLDIEYEPKILQKVEDEDDEVILSFWGRLFGSLGFYTAEHAALARKYPSLSKDEIKTLLKTQKYLQKIDGG